MFSFSAMEFTLVLTMRPTNVIAAMLRRAVISGVSQLRGGQVESPDIRAGMAMLVAALCAEGQSVIYNIGQIERGYERIDERLRALGADIERRDD